MSLPAHPLPEIADPEYVRDWIGSRVEIKDMGHDTPCWLWRLSLSVSGYACAIISAVARRRKLPIHRVSYEVARGRIPEGLAIDHLCKVRSCLNPAHLEAVTHAENNRRARGSEPGYCVKGHRMTPANSYTYPSGKIDCRACHRINHKRWKMRRKLAQRKGAAHV